MGNSNSTGPRCPSLQSLDTRRLELRAHTSRRKPLPDIPTNKNDARYFYLLRLPLNASKPKQVLDATVRLEGIAQFYLNKWENINVLHYADQGHLVFRVPFQWLEDNALFCDEALLLESGICHMPDSAPPLFVAALEVPRTYRITSSRPLQNEATRLMSNDEVGRELNNARLHNGS